MINCWLFFKTEFWRIVVIYQHDDENLWITTLWEPPSGLAGFIGHCLKTKWLIPRLNDRNDSFPLKDQTLTVMDFNKHWWKDLSQQVQDMRGMNDMALPSDNGMPLVECSLVNGVRHLKMKFRKSFDLWRRTDKTDSNSFAFFSSYLMVFYIIYILQVLV